jgi:hypothetical protein
MRIIGTEAKDSQGEMLCFRPGDITQGGTIQSELKGALSGPLA